MSIYSVLTYSKVPNHNREWHVFGAVYFLSEDIRRKTEHYVWESTVGISYTRAPVYLTAVELTVTLPPLTLEFMQHVHKAQADKKIHFNDKTYFGASFHMFAVVQLDPGVPAMTVQRQAVPLVQQHRLFRPNYSNTRTTIEPEKKKKHSGHKPFREVWRMRDLGVSKRRASGSRVSFQTSKITQPMVVRRPGRPQSLLFSIWWTVCVSLLQLLNHLTDFNP